MRPDATPDFSQEQLAQAAGCSTGYIRLLEKGFDPRFSDVMPRIHEVLNTKSSPEAATSGSMETSDAGGGHVSG